MRVPSVSDWLGGGSTWGKADRYADPRVLRRLRRVYDGLSLLGEALIAIFLIGFVAFLVWLATEASFEDVIFWDGTDHICVLDSKTGEVRYVDGR